MEDLPEGTLDEVVERLREALDPVAVILYGSHAYGTPSEGSDVDLLVVVDPGAPGSGDGEDGDEGSRAEGAERDEVSSHELAVAAYEALQGTGLPVEVKVDTVEEFEQLKTWVSSVEREAADRGRVLYRDRGRGRGLVA